MLISGLAVVLVAMLMTVTTMVSDFHLVVGKIDETTTLRGPAPPADTVGTVAIRSVSTP